MSRWHRHARLLQGEATCAQQLHNARRRNVCATPVEVSADALQPRPRRAKPLERLAEMGAAGGPPLGNAVCEPSPHAAGVPSTGCCERLRSAATGASSLPAHEQVATACTAPARLSNMCTATTTMQGDGTCAQFPLKFPQTPSRQGRGVPSHFRGWPTWAQPGGLPLAMLCANRTLMPQEPRLQVAVKGCDRQPEDST